MEKPCILIVDDEKNIRLTLARAVKPLQVPVQTAVNGEEALEKLRDTPCGLVFLDLKMPGMDGIEVLRRIRASWPTIPVAIVTGHGTIALAVEAMKLGAIDFIQKPFSPAEILEVARQVVPQKDRNEGSDAT
jgi:DNA-binding NtrC family response regulator